MAGKKQSKVGKMKAGVTGGAILGLLILGAYLGQLFNFNGPGNGGEAENNKESTVNVKVETPEPQKDPVTTDDNNEKSNAVPEVIEIIIDEKDYLLKEGIIKPYKKISLDQIIAMTQKATGNSDGLRLRIFRRPTSKASAEIKLQKAIDEAKIPELAVYHVQKLLED